MKIAAYIVLLLLLVGCNASSDEKKTEDHPVDSNASTQPTTGETFSIQPIKLTKEQLPGSIKFKGTIQEAWQWKDKLGENILVTSYVAPYADKRREDIGDDASTAELHAFHFLKEDTSYKLLWKLSDAEKSCPFDITCGFFKNTMPVTDLDKNGIAETTIQYMLVCRSDVSPAYKKLIMHEDTIKYSLRGYMCDPGSNPGKTGCVTEADVNLEKQPAAKEEWEKYTRLFGRYETEKEFTKAPPEFLIHARSQWLKHAKESFD